MISCKMVELTFEYGNSTISTGAYSMLSLTILCLQMSPSFADQVDQIAVCLLHPPIDVFYRHSHFILLHFVLFDSLYILIFFISLV